MSNFQLSPYRIVLQCLLCGLFFSLLGCTQDPPTIRLAAISGGSEEPTMLFEGFRMVSTKGKTVEWEFTARAAQIYEKINLAKAQDIQILYWRNGKVISTLTADRAVIQTDTNDMRAEENVVMVSHEGVLLYTERLNWNHTKEIIYTDLPVRVVREGSVLTGVGLETDSELKHLEVLSDVKIKVRSLEELENKKEPVEKSE
jgi:LPS export ABC transporter protein LptC